jgi:hypothetical protein
MPDSDGEDKYVMEAGAFILFIASFHCKLEFDELCSYSLILMAFTSGKSVQATVTTVLPASTESKHDSHTTVSTISIDGVSFEKAGSQELQITDADWKPSKQVRFG